IALCGDDGRTLRYICSFLDTTDKHQTEEQLRRSRDELAGQTTVMADRVKFINDLLDSIPMAVSMRDPEGRYVLVNRTWERYYGVSREQAVGAIVREVLQLTPEQAAPRDALDREALARGPGNPLVTPDFQYRDRYYASRRTAMLDARGRPLGIV